MIDAQFDKFFREVYDQDASFPGPQGWIQWKGTDVCADMRCPCGFHGHIDGEFAYYYKCAGCGARYALGCVIKLIPLTDEQADYAATRHSFAYDISEDRP